MRRSLSSVILALAMPCLATTAFAQDELDDPEGGDMGDAGGDEAGGDFGGEASLDDLGGGGGGGGPEKPISVGLLLGYGISLEDGGNPWGLGFGVRGGYNIDAIYLGVRFVYYLGESEDIPDPFGGGSTSVSVNVWELGIEGGYDIAAGDTFTVRPSLGLGIANIGSSGSVGGFDVSASSTEFYLAPGVSGLLDVTDSIFIGAEARFKIVLADETFKALTLLATGGMRF
jgi:hypothetical protein